MEPGDTAYILIDSNKPYKVHILTFVDHYYVVYKWYGRHKQYWHYRVEHYETLKMRIEKLIRINEERRIQNETFNTQKMEA